MTSRRLDRALVPLLAGFLVLALAVMATIWLTVRLDEATRRVSHTLEVENRIAAVMSRLQDAETGQRGFLLTGHKEFLQPYEAALSRLDLDLSSLEASVSDNPRQIANVARLRAIADARQDVLREVLTRFRNGETLKVLTPRLDEGRRLMDALRAEVRRMKGEEESLLEHRTRAARQATVVVQAALVFSTLTVFALAWFAVIDARRRLKAALESRNAADEATRRMQAEAENRELAEAKVRQYEKMQAIGELTGGIAHDFNNMLAIVIGSLDLAKRRLTADPVRAEACIDNAAEGAQRAAQLTARLLAFSRQQPLAPRTLDVNKLVGGMSELLRRTLGEDMRVETVLSGGLWRARADPAQLENAILNLCVNARDAMPGGGRMTIETSNAYLDDDYAVDNIDVEPGQYVLISVTDTGTGMPQEVVERVFEPFYTTKGVGRGTGLGLSQVHGFIKQSKGHAKIYSEPGVGTTVKLYLPRDLSREQVLEIQARPVGELPRSRGEETVLVVEDEERVRHLSVDALRELGYLVVQASDAAQALTVLTLQPRVDLLFTDVVMPDMSGRRLADKAHERWPDLPVLYTTGYTRNAIVHNGMLDADVAFLPKPFTIEQLARKVRQVLDEARTAPAD